MLYCHLNIDHAKIYLSDMPDPNVHYLQVLERPKQAVKYVERNLEPFLILHPANKVSFYLHVSMDHIGDNKRVKSPVPNAVLLSLHKSNLQKAIRLGNKPAALFSLEWLYKFDPIQLLRRLPIILLEDSSIHPYFSLLVLYSMIYNEIDPKYDEIILQQLKQVVLDAIANSTHQRSIVYHNTPETIPLDFLQKPLETLDKQTDLLFMYIRYCYGGLEGDMIMLQRFILYGLNKNNSLQYCSILEHQQEKNLVKEEQLQLLSAVDFHVFPILLEDCRKQLERKHINIDCYTIKSTIWNCRSRTNFREEYSPSPPIWWDELLVYLDKESKLYWNIYTEAIVQQKKEQKEEKEEKKKKESNTMFNYFKKV